MLAWETMPVTGGTRAFLPMDAKPFMKGQDTEAK